MQITISNLCANCEDLFAFFDPQAFGRIKGTFHPETTKGLSAYHLHCAQAHPMAVLWHRVQSEIAKSKVAGSIQFSEETLLFLDALVRIKEFVSPAEIPDIIRHMETILPYYGDSAFYLPSDQGVGGIRFRA